MVNAQRPEKTTQKPDSPSASHQPTPYPYSSVTPGAQDAPASGVGPTGDPNTPSPQSSHDAALQRLQELEQQLAALERDKAELEQKRYVDTSLSEFSDVMRLGVDTTLESWSDTLLDALVPYINGLQGALYLLETSEAPTSADTPSANEATSADTSSAAEASPATASTAQGQQYLRRVGGYALPQGAKPQLALGQGVTGQAAKTAQRQYYDDPNAFTAHTESGLTEVEAQVLLVLPLIHNEEVVGVLELTGMQPFSDAVLEFLERFCEHAAANLQTLRSQEHIRTLYQQAQEKQEALQAQEEEMRQNVEELEATQEEMKRVQQQLQDESELNRRVFESSQSGIALYNVEAGQFIDCNPAMVQLLGLTQREEVIGHGPADFSASSQGEEEQSPAAFLQAQLDATRSEGQHTFDWRIVRQDTNEERDMEVQQSAFQYKEQQHIQVAMLDKTEQKEYERQIQERNEQLASQEEEMRQNVEELEATQEEMKRVQQELEAQQDILQGVLDGSDDTFVVIDTDYKLILANQVMVQNFKANGMEVRYGDGIFNYLPPEQHDYYRELYDRCLAGESFTEPVHYQMGNLDKHFEVRYYPLRNRAEEIIGAVAAARDISERKQREEEIQKKSAIFENSRDAIGLIELREEEGPVYIEVNQAYADLFGFDAPEGLIGTMPEDYAPEYQPDGTPSGEAGEYYVNQALEHGEILFEWCSMRTNGETFDSEVFLCTVEIGGQTLLQVTEREISERKKQEQELKKKSAIFEHSRDAIGLVELGEEGPVFVEANQAYAELFGLASPQDLIGASPIQYAPAYQPDGSLTEDLTKQYIATVMEEGSGLFEIQNLDCQGNPFDSEMHINILQMEGRTLLQATARDITQRKQQEAELRRKTAMFDNSWDAMAIIRGPYFIEVNQAYAQLFGAADSSEVLGTSPDQWSPAYQPNGEPSATEAPKRIQHALASGANRFEWRHQRADGSVFDAEVFLSVLHHAGEELVQATVRDITERKQRERQLQLKNSIVDNSREAIALHDGATYVEVNQAYLNLLGIRSKAEILGNTPLDFSPAEQPDGTPTQTKAEQVIEQALEEGHSRFQWRHLTQAEEPLDCEVQLTRIEHEGKHLVQANVRLLAQ